MYYTRSNIYKLDNINQKFTISIYDTKVITLFFLMIRFVEYYLRTITI